MKKFIFMIAVFFILVLHWFFSPYYLQKEPKENNKIEEKIDSTFTVSFSAVGDIMCHSTQFNYARIKKDSFDFKPVFGVIGNYLRSKDVLFGNLETVLAGNTHHYYGYPFFNSPNELAEALKYAGFDFLFTANNHANDQGEKGVERTINELRKINIIPIGTNIIKTNTIETKKFDKVKEKNIFIRKGIKFGVLAYTYGTNYNENALTPGEYVNYIDTVRIKKDITSLKNRNADLIIVYFHFGKEYIKQPTLYQKRIVEKTISYGVDVILSSHPHIVQKFEKFKTNNGNLDSGFVTYSLGNFLSNQRWRYSDGGLIFNFDITKNIFSDSVYVSNIDYLPIWVFKGKVNGKKEFIILPSEDFSYQDKYSFITKADIDSMKRSYFDTIELFTEGKQYPSLEKFNK